MLQPPPALHPHKTYPAIQRVQHTVSSSISYAARTMRLTAFTLPQSLTSKRSLVNLTILQATERHADVLQLQGQKQGQVVGKTKKLTLKKVRVMESKCKGLSRKHQVT